MFPYGFVLERALDTLGAVLVTRSSFEYIRFVEIYMTRNFYIIKSNRQQKHPLVLTLLCGVPVVTLAGEVDME